MASYLLQTGSDVKVHTCPMLAMLLCMVGAHIIIFGASNHFVTKHALLNLLKNSGVIKEVTY